MECTSKDGFRPRAFQIERVAVHPWVNAEPREGHITDRMTGEGAHTVLCITEASSHIKRNAENSIDSRT